MPDGLTATVSSLATDLWHDARNAAQAEAKTRVSEAASDVAEARSAAREAGEKADALASELDAARERTAELEEMVAERDRQIDAYVLQVRQLEVEDARKAGEIVSLQNTLTQFAPGADQMRSMHPVAVGQTAA